MSDDFIVISLITTDPAQRVGCLIVRKDAVYPFIFRKVYGPKSFQDCFAWRRTHCSAVDPWWDQARDAAIRAERDINERGVAVHAAVQRKVELGHVDGVPEVKTEWEGGWIKYPVFYTRASKITAFAEVSAPADLLAAYWSDIAACAVNAAGVATLVAILASPTAALPAFKAAFVACLTGKVDGRINEISVVLGVEQIHGEWRRL